MAAIVTGGGSGIGFEIAKILYLEEGQDLILVGRNVDRLQVAKLCLEKELLRKKPSIHIYPLDVSDLSACITFHKKFEESKLPLAYLINAAGFGTIGSFLETDLEKEACETDTNCRGLLQMTKLFLPDLIKREGKLLNVASSAGYMPGSPGMAVYYATKAYVLSLTRSIQAEKAVRESKVLISALCRCHGRTWFDFGTGLRPGSGSRLEKRQASDHSGPFDEIYLSFCQNTAGVFLALFRKETSGT